jgi:transcriptional regulator with XRE-family HTH domain
MSETSTKLLRKLGGELRGLREAAGRTEAEMAERLGSEIAVLAAIEDGSLPVRPVQLHTMLAAYGATVRQAQRLAELARKGVRDAWWRPQIQPSPPYGGLFYALEGQAETAWYYDPRAIPDLAWPPDYAQWVLQRSFTEQTPEEIRHQLDVLRLRRERLEAPGAPRTWLVVEELMLDEGLRQSGFQAAVCARLLRLADLPHVTVRVCSRHAGIHALSHERVRLLEFGGDHPAYGLFIDSFVFSMYQELDDDTVWYRSSVDELLTEALDPDTSIDLITSIATRATDRGTGGTPSGT